MFKATILVVGAVFVGASIQPALGATKVPQPLSSFKGNKVVSRGLDRSAGDVRWILPGQRALDPALFGTPAAPLGFEPDVGVPVGGRLTNNDGTAFTTTAGPVPFSNRFADVTGGYRMSVRDRTLDDDLKSKDTINFQAKLTSPDGARSYKVRVKRILPVGVLHPVFGGVGINMLHHGMTGIGTKLQPTAPTIAAFWGIGNISVDGALSPQGKDRLVHGMITCSVRNENYQLVFDSDVDCSRIHFHLFLPPFKIEKTKGGFAEVPSPVPTGFILPNGVEQPFIHGMFENIRLQMGDDNGDG
ncbi:MAG: hypothetical protein ACR2RB_19105 [Gammaproteobacteria bacterium]